MMRSSHDIAPPPPRFPDAWPALGLGLAPLGNIFRLYPETQAVETLSAAWDAGIRYFDTAPWYGHGLSEHRLGGLLRQHPRQESLVSTKVGRIYHPAARGEDARVKWEGGLNFGLRYDYSAAGFEASLMQSQLRLGQPAIDALIIHDLDQEYHGDAFDGHIRDLTASGLGWLKEIRTNGQISAFGMGINTLDAFRSFADWLEVDFFLVAMPYTLLDQASLHGPMQRCLDRGIKVIIGAPFASGTLTNPSDPALQYNYGPVPEAIRAKALAIEASCRRHDVPLMAAALQFPLFHPAVVSVIPGAVTPDQVRQNARNAAVMIPPDLWHDLRREGLIDPDAPAG